MRDTPETDKAERMAYSQEYMVPTDFARKLERERDEAWELLASEKITRNHIIKRSVEVERERDDAREEAKRLDGAYEDATNYYARIIELTDERDEAREALMKIEDLFIDCTDVIACRENMGMIAIAALLGIK